MLEKIVPFYIVCFFTRKKINKFCQIYCKTFMKREIKYRIFNCVNFVIPFYYGSRTVIKYDTGSAMVCS
jgi:hypothetical protein